MFGASSGSDTAVALAMALLAAAADPIETKKRLDEIAAATKESNDLLQDAQRMRRENDEHTAAIGNAQKVLDKTAANQATRQGELDNRETKIAEWEKTLAEREAKLTADAKAVQQSQAARDAALSQRESAVTDREQKHAAAQSAFATDRTALDRMMAKARALLES